MFSFCNCSSEFPRLDCLCLSDLRCFVFFDFSSFCTLGSILSYIVPYFITANVLVNCLETKLALEQQRCRARESLGDLSFLKLAWESGSTSFFSNGQNQEKAPAHSSTLFLFSQATFRSTDHHQASCHIISHHIISYDAR